MRKGPKSKVPAAAPPAAADTKKKGKVARKWEEDGPGKIDYSEKSGQQEVLTSISLCCLLLVLTWLLVLPRPQFEASDKYGDASEPINADDWDAFFKSAQTIVLRHTPLSRSHDAHALFGCPSRRQAQPGGGGRR
jgi:hypothetical protein